MSRGGNDQKHDREHPKDIENAQTDREKNAQNQPNQKKRDGDYHQNPIHRLDIARRPSPSCIFIVPLKASPAIRRCH
jgi:hypothetical protein